jgi:GNAT superfamily N-acetyltransferase
MGITAETWGPLFDSGDIIGMVCEDASGIVGFCSGDAKTGEILVLAVLPDYEGLGAGKTLLSQVASQLAQLGFDRLWLAASPDPATRAHGFYRHCGWRPTGQHDDRGDEILELV